MEQSMFLKGAPHNGIHHHSFSYGSQRHVTYSCGICGYELNLSSCNRITSTIGSKYGKSIKRGIISFFNIDESRFTQVDEIRCIPFFSKNSWGLFRPSTKLLCRKCGNRIGKAYDDKALTDPVVVSEPDSSPGNATSTARKYHVKIRALQPSSVSVFSTPLNTGSVLPCTLPEKCSLEDDILRSISRF